MSDKNPALEMWPRVADADAQALVQLAVPYVRWFRPSLVATLVADNDAHRPAWTAVLNAAPTAPDPDLYLWPGSACAYPGIRRKTGGKEQAGTAADQCLATDVSGNNLAHRVWELLDITKRGFVQSRVGFELVHLFPHKAAEWKKLLLLLDAQVPAAMQALPTAWRTRLEAHGLPGLFTNPANMCFLPSTLVRPTDGHSLFRQVLWQKALALYGAPALLPAPVAAPLAQWLHLLPDSAGLNWSECYHGDEAHLPNLLNDRRKRLKAYQ